MKRTIAKLMMIALLGAGCAKDPNTGVQGEMGVVRFGLSVPSSQRAATRTVGGWDDAQVNEVDVLVFDGTGTDNALFHSRRTATAVAGQPGFYEVILPQGTWDMMILANSGDILDATQADLVAKGTTLKEAREEVIRKTIGNPWKWGTEAIPMSAHLLNETIDTSDTGTTIANIVLRRMLARVDVTNAATADSDSDGNNDFELQTVYFCDYNTVGSVIHRESSLSMPLGQIRRMDIDEAQFFTNITGNELTGVIYTPEAAPTARPCLIVGGSYNGGATSWYRMDFVEDADPVTGFRDPITVQRNNEYNFVIEGVSKEGKDTPEDAYDLTEVNLQVSVKTWSDVEEDLAPSEQTDLHIWPGKVINIDEFGLAEFGNSQRIEITSTAGTINFLEPAWPIPANAWFTVQEVSNTTTAQGVQTVVLQINAQENTSLIQGRYNSRPLQITDRNGKVIASITVNQARSRGIQAPPGVLGVGVYSKQLTLRGSNRYAGSEVEAANWEYFGGVSAEPVYAVYWKYRSLIGMYADAPANEPADYNAVKTNPMITAEHIAWAPPQYDISQITHWGIRFEGTGYEHDGIPIETNREGQIPKNVDDTNLIEDPSRGLGDPCAYADGGNDEFALPYLWMNYYPNEQLVKVVDAKGNHLAWESPDKKIYLPSGGFIRRGNDGDGLTGSGIADQAYGYYWSGSEFAANRGVTQTGDRMNYLSLTPRTTTDDESYDKAVDGNVDNHPNWDVNGGMLIRCLPVRTTTPTIKRYSDNFPSGSNNIPATGGTYTLTVRKNVREFKVMLYDGKEAAAIKLLQTVSSAPAPDINTVPKMTMSNEEMTITVPANTSTADRVLSIYLHSAEAGIDNWVFAGYYWQAGA